MKVMVLGMTIRKAIVAYNGGVESSFSATQDVADVINAINTHADGDDFVMEVTKQELILMWLGNDVMRRLELTSQYGKCPSFYINDDTIVVGLGYHHNRKDCNEN